MSVNNGDGNLDDVLKKFNTFGRYHLQTAFLMFYGLSVSIMHCSNYVFVAEKTGYSVTMLFRDELEFIFMFKKG
ncbi:jg14978 [Pararge aegeria aegeria]|uniref:Jg14978 protein n=1 Tax=Pararge aegeria aegeria TaxID=348720 RepID=A0A8S4SFN5_9NEOP|nr:jg14978 [Pararge aegeria aegeria]